MRTNCSNGRFDENYHDDIGRNALNSFPPSHFDILGVPLNANEQEIKAAFRAAAMKLHPDRVVNLHTNSPSRLKRDEALSEAHLKFIALKEAYEVLSNPISRLRYSQALLTEVRRAGQKHTHIHTYIHTHIHTQTHEIFDTY